MTITKDFDSEFTIPPQGTIINGKLKVYDWAKARVLVDKQVVNNLLSVDCSRIADQAGSGNATVKISDPDKTIYNSIKENSELEIYLSEETPMTYGNKVWGGWLKSKEFVAGESYILTLTAMEYMQELVTRLTGDSAVSDVNSFTFKEPGEIIITLMSNYQVDFTTDNVLTGTSNEMSVEFINKSVYESIKQICDTFNYVFYINLDKDLVVRNRTDVISSSDTLVTGENIIKITQEKNRQYLVNNIRVYGDSSSATASDQDSIDTYGESMLKLATPALKSNADCEIYATSYINTWKDPIESIKVNAKLITNSEPFQYITVDAEGAELDGSYQIISMTHRYSKSGLYTELVLSKIVSDLSINLGQLMSRLSQVETTTYG